MTPLRIVLTSLILAVALALVGFGWGWFRFGFSDAALAARLERNVRDIVEAQAATVESLARQVAGEAALIADATASRERLTALFDRLQTLATPTHERVAAVTVYVADPPVRDYRVLAWSDGPAERDLLIDRLAGPSALFVTPGHAGLQLVAVEPIVRDGRTIAVAVAETLLAPVDRTSTRSIERRLSTAYGPVSVIAQYVSARDGSAAHSFAVASGTGVPLIEVHFDPAALAARRHAFYRGALAVSLLPLPLGLAALTAAIGWRRPRGATAWTRWRHVGWRSVAAILVAAAVAGIVRLGNVPPVVSTMVLIVGALVAVIGVSATLWWHASRFRPSASPARAAAEHLVGGVLLAGAIETVARLLDRWMTIAVLDRGPFVLFPFSATHTLSIGRVLLSETVIAWLTVSLLAALAIRWRVSGASRHALAASALWLLPSAALVLVPSSLAGRAGWIPLGIAGAAVVFALAAVPLRRFYRRATQSGRLLLALLAGLAPLVALYPLAAVTADRATRHVIETRYAPATAGHPQELLAELRRAQQRVDEMAMLPDLVSAAPSNNSQAASFVWSQTDLARARVISDVELYGPDRALVDRFAFNLPEYVYRTTLEPWQGTSCTWTVVGEVTPFGAEERHMLHAERGICDADGRLLGGIVLHVASNDYQALPFISSPNPYYDILSANDAGPRLPGATLAVYGWSSQPIFTSGRAAWPVEPDWFDRLYREGTPFWTRIAADDATYDVHFSQNRVGVYALGVPRLTWIEHVTRLAEIAVIVTVFFVVWQVGLLVHAWLTRQSRAPLRQILHEVRTSFYRKLFISFVVVAVVPVLAAAVTFGGYMTARFRTDVEYEASTTVAVARRVFQELIAGERGVDQPPLRADAVIDDVMVWIRQVIGHDVNLFNGSELVVTSQRDLFNSGFLPMRTPATVYRAIALERRPVIVAEDRLGAFSYVVAAAPIAAWGRDAVLTVPLAPRQREMERELDTLNRRVLVGAVVVVLFAAGIGTSLAGRIADPVARLTRATRQIAAGRLDVRVTTDTADELQRLVDDFNSMAATLGSQRAELARSHQLKAWNEMARQVAHEIKNPLTPVQLAAEHLRHVHEDRGRPLGTVLDRCVETVLAQVRLLRQIASEFANFAGEPTPRPSALDVATLVNGIVDPYRIGLRGRVEFDVKLDASLPPIWVDRTLISRALTNLVENAVQAMPGGGSLRVTGHSANGRLVLTLTDTGVGMDALALERAFEPYFSTKTGGSGLGLANAKRNIEREGGTVTIASEPGRGATVTVTLPEAAAPLAGREDASPPSR